MGRPKKYHTEEERREAARQKNRKYYNANRKAISARRAKRARKRRAAVKAGQKETQAPSCREALETNVNTPASISGKGNGAGVSDCSSGSGGTEWKNRSTS